MRHLYLKIYLAFLAILAVFAVLMGVLWWLTPGMPESARYTESVTALVGEALGPAAEPPAAMQSRLARIAGRLPGHVTIRSASGELLASHGEVIPWPPGGVAATGVFRGFGHPPMFALKLDDGRAVLFRSEHRPRFVGFLAALVLLAATTAAGAFFVVRRITARLERLGAGVRALGGGDLSARVAVEGRDEVARLAANFNDAAARIESLVGAHRTLLANVSHELRAPLARVRMAAELLPGSDVAPLAHRIGLDVAELDALVGELLLSSRLDAQTDALRLEPVDLLALCAEEAADFGSSVHGEALSVQADERLLRRLVRNLLENARRYASVAPAEVAISAKGQLAVIDVMDRGPGVPDSEREKIFEPFYRPAGVSETGQGYGLGLALVRQIAHKHGGEVTCHPREGGGCRFEVLLRRVA